MTERSAFEIALDVVTASTKAAIVIGGEDADLFQLENAVSRAIDEAGLGQYYVDIHK